VRTAGGLGSLVLFLDRSLGKREVAAVLRAAGATVEIHDDHFPQDATDADWILDVGRRGWFVPTKDDNIRHRPLEKAAVRVAGVGLFALKGGNLRGAQMAHAFVAALPGMVRLTRRIARPFIARVSASGAVSVLETFS
jgi:hypothetical protein